MRQLIIGLTLAVVAFGCDSDDPPRSQEPPANNPPLADAGPDQTNNVFAGDIVTLDGSGSTDPDGDAINYLWALEMAPAGSAATLSDATTPTPSVAVDIPGEYVVLLVVYDQEFSSAPDAVSISAITPPPTVSLDTPEDGFITDTSPITVSGTVTGSDVAVTVNGNLVPHIDGSISVDVALQEGNNIISVVAANESGEAVATAEVVLSTSGRPALWIGSPLDGFLAGEEFDLEEDLTPANATVRGRIKVNTTLDADTNRPMVTVNGQLVDATDVKWTPLRCGLTPSLKRRCWSFSKLIALQRGDHVITVEVTDASGLSSNRKISGIVDYCRKVWTSGPEAGDWEDGILALYQGANRMHPNNNRCHEIDGCSVPNDRNWDNDPMMSLGAVCNLKPTAFGSGRTPVKGELEYLVHGLNSKDNLPCNKHDVCFQTCVTPAGQVGAREDMRPCNNRMYEDMVAVCRAAYPVKALCPHRFGSICNLNGICHKYKRERILCFQAAAIYRTGLGTPQSLTKFEDRQRHYCAN